MHDVLPATPSGKIELFPSSLEKCSAAGLYNYIDDDTNGDRFPLALISPATRKTVNSSLGYLVEEQAVATVHPADAAARQIRDGDTIRVFNDRGEVGGDVNVRDSVAPGIVSLAKGIWLRHTKIDRTSNALSPDTLSDIGDGACFNDARVEIQLVQQSVS